MKNGKTCSSSCVEDETAIITCSNAHRSFASAADTHLRSSISGVHLGIYGRRGYKRNLDASGSVYRIRFISRERFFLRLFSCAVGRADR